MENNKCEEIMNQYLMLDKNERVPFKLAMHIMFCKKCRRQIKMLSFAEHQIAEPLKIQTPVTDVSIKNVMLKIAPDVYAKMLQKPIPIGGWILGGILMICLLIFSIFVIGKLNNRDLSMAYGLMIACCVTIYCAIFVFGNIDVFVKKISTHISGDWQLA